MPGEMPKKDSLDSMEDLPRQDILVEFVPSEEEKIKVKQAKVRKGTEKEKNL